MNTPAHLILGLAAFGKPGQTGLCVAALAGGLLPDLSLYLLAGGALAVGVPAERVFGELYFSEAWQTVFAIDNSAPLWLGLLAVALWRRSGWGVALTGSALLHLATDLPLHNDDGRPHFWPLTDWVFESPLSYWDVDHHAGWVAPGEIALTVGLAVWLLTRLQDWRLRAVVVALVAAELSVGGLWSIVLG